MTFERISSEKPQSILNDKQFRELLEGGSISMFIRIFGIGAGYAFTLLITKFYGAETMGIFALSLTVLSIGAMIGKLGLHMALLRFVAEYSSKGENGLLKGVYIKSMWIAVPSSLIVATIIFIISPYMAVYIFRKEHLVIYFRIAALMIPLMVLADLHLESLRGIKRIKEYFFLQNVAIYLLSTLFLVVSLLIFTNKFVPLISYSIAVAVVSGLSYFLWMLLSGVGRYEYIETIKSVDLLSVSIPIMLSGSLYLVMYWTDTIMLGAIRSEVEVGIYNVALKVASIASLTSFAVNSIAAPKFAEYFGKRDFESLKTIVQHSTKLIFFSSLPIFICLFAFPEQILKLFGEEFTSGVYALIILTAGYLINVASGLVGYILQMTDRHRVFQKIIFLSAVMNVALNAILIPFLGINGAAIASSLSMAFLSIFSAVTIKKELDILTIYIPVLSK